MTSLESGEAASPGLERFQRSGRPDTEEFDVRLLSASDHREPAAARPLGQEYGYTMSNGLRDGRRPTRSGCKLRAIASVASVHAEPAGHRRARCGTHE